MPETRPIPEWPAYVATEDGQVMRNGRALRWYRHHAAGSPYVQVSKPSDGRSLRVAGLVAEAFHGRCPPRHAVRHKDGDLGNCRPSNLEWAERSAILQDRIARGTTNRGQKHGMAKLSPELVRYIRSEKARGRTCEDIAVEVGCSGANISHVARGFTWSHVL